MTTKFWVLGCAFGLLGVAAGAFGAHGLRSRVAPDLLLIWETAVRFHVYHALALLSAAWAVERWPGSAASWAGWLFAAGVVVFSGSLYLLTLSGLRWLGAVTPIGGLLLLAGWIALGLAGLQGVRTSPH